MNHPVILKMKIIINTGIAFFCLFITSCGRYEKRLYEKPRESYTPEQLKGKPKLREDVNKQFDVDA